MYHPHAPSTPIDMTEKKHTAEPPRHKSQRFAKRVSGAQWKAEVTGISESVRVLKLSRIGIELEIDSALEAGARYRIQLAHNGETTHTIFYVLRCPPHGQGTARVYRPAGLFVETLDRADLPETIPDAP
jgi:hypothetical protein